MNLNQVTLAVNDIAQAVEFYQTLGLKQIVSDVHYARFTLPDGDATFSVYLDPDKQSLQSRGVIYFECQQLDSRVAELQSQGIEFETEPTDKPYLWREVSLKDPSGNQIKLYWAGDNRRDPPWKLGKSEGA
ncbi:glyoxalase/dioxygenase superfamily protein [Vibrio ponticus]|nr:glyoxalase/dioxygenase superfamily protein [Vibrio ponticus]